ncbi:glycosyltransferase [Membranicola marinus]|uniref:Glycosyltransferase n=1 Tax=Membranihabitans marinus TaxID=1227546 RepID=A0A953HRH0_9BACT|nr:glycosyltransferase family 4 protein [Membranihabitans marinus]MBY5959914.1 glycosyltransferase [Membranihabitans marinus]
MKSKNIKNVLFVAPFMESFIKGDIKILSRHFNVITNIYPWKNKKFTLWYMLQQLWLIVFNMYKLDAIVVSFGGYWALIPAMMGRVLGIPVYIIVHGTDCCSIPSINYGMLRKQPLKMVCAWSYSLSTMILPVSDSLKHTINTYYDSADKNEKTQGILHFFPKLKTSFRTIFNGLDPKFWIKDSTNTNRSENSFITVLSEAQYKRKGGDLIVKAAKKFPNATFYIAGTSTIDLDVAPPDNVIWLGRLSPEELRMYYRKSTFYLQLSIFEGFGCALCEAMLTECIPIGSSANMIPEIIGDTGFILKKRDIRELESILNHVLSISDKAKMGKMARDKVIKDYTFDIRERKLLTILT